MSDLQAIADRVEIEALRGEFTDASMQRDYRRTPEGWKFAERVYEVRYVDGTPLAGSGTEPGAEAGGSVGGGAE